MTITAWINAASLPVEDAAIVSQLQGFQDHALGSGFRYQLDTTVDTGPRTIGFKLTDACGYLMARYVGHSAPHEDWYHLARVYDAEARALHVYWLDAVRKIQSGLDSNK
jgi:hypothetical protein